MLDAVFLLGLTLWAAGLGLWFLSRWVDRPANPLDALGLAIPTGLGILTLGGWGLGEIGRLDRAGFLILFAMGSIPAVIELARFVKSLSWPHRPHGFLGIAFDLALIVTLLGTWLTAVIPATDGDALCYHLQVPKIFLHDGATTFEPDLHETVYPLVTEMLFAVALEFRGTEACRLVSWVLGICLALNVSAIARPILGDRARWAGTITLLAPAVSNGMGATLNDVALAAFANAALSAYLYDRDHRTILSAFFVGILTGFALGVKYPALVWAGVLGLGMLARRGPSPRYTGLRVLAFAVTALGVGGVWYARAYVHTGNPVYPFFRHYFGGSGIDDVLDPIKRPMAVTLGSVLTALGPMTLQPDRFDSFSHQFGPIFLMTLPLAAFYRPPAYLWRVGMIGFAFLTLCVTQRQSMRFVLAALGPFAVVAAWCVATWWDRGTTAGRIMVGLIVAILGFEAAMAVGRVRQGADILLGRESATEFLSRREPTYRVGLWIDAHLRRSARIIGQEHRGYYLPRSYTMELAHRRRTGLASRGESSETIVRILQAEGFTHLLLCPPEPENAVEFDPTMSRSLAPWLARHQPLYREPITDPDGVLRRYAIYDLGADR